MSTSGPNTQSQTESSTVSQKSASPESPIRGDKVHVRALIISGQSYVFSFNPETTVGRAKELIWSSWPHDWTEPTQPPSPSYLRLLHGGKILQDDSTLKTNKFLPTPDSSSATVVHISVRSFSIKGDDDPKKPGMARSSTSRSHHVVDDEVSGCRCTIM